MGYSYRDDYPPPAPPPQAPPPQHSPPPMAPPGQSKGYATLIIIGICILALGAIIMSSVGFLEEPDEDDYDMDEYEDYQDDMKDYQKQVKNMITSGNIIEYVGVMILGIGVVIGAVKDETLSANVRLGLLIALGLIVGFVIGGTGVPFYYAFL